MNRIVEQLVNIILSLIPDNFLAVILDKLLTEIEILVKNSDNKIDDAVILPLINLARKSLNLSVDNENKK